MANNGSRELILQRIRTGLKTQVPVPPPMSDEAMIFPPVEDPMARFQQECKTNLMELSTTQDASASAQQIAGILNSLPEGEIYVQDTPSLRQLMTMVATAKNNSMVKRGTAARNGTGHHQPGRSACRSDRVCICERGLRRSWDLCGRAVPCGIRNHEPACSRPENSSGQRHTKRAAAKQFLRVHD